MLNLIDNAPRQLKVVILILIDAVLLTLSFIIALSIRINEIFPLEFIPKSLGLFSLLIVSMPFFYILFGLHRIRMTNFDISAVMKTVTMIVCLSAFSFILNLLMIPAAPRTVPIIFGLVYVIMILFARLVTVALIRKFIMRVDQQVKVAIFGAGQAGIQLISSLQESRDFNPTFLVDDNKKLHGLYINGLRIRAPNKLNNAHKKGQFEKIFLAMPSMTSTRRRNLLRSLSVVGCEIREIPNYIDVIKTGNVAGSLKQVEPEELLARPKVSLGSPEVNAAITGKNVMVTGAGGSIGSEICRQVTAYNAKHVILFEQSEIALYKIENELRQLNKGKNIEIIPVLGSVCDQTRVEKTLNEANIDVIFHAAAYKHVPLVEENEIEGARNNILGTEVVARAALKHNAERFVLVSTDKAVNPTNIMGASKRIAELIVQNMQLLSDKTIFSNVRFGNVLGSSGSVVPRFKEQIANGGPVSLTHLDVTRYFMTIPEASSLVLLAGAVSTGGEVFVLDMGEPIKIYDLAERLIHMSGLSVKDENNPQGDIEIQITGLRAGEKLYEELLIGDNTLPTPHSKIFRAQEAQLSPMDMDHLSRDLHHAFAADDAAKLRQLLEKWVEGYHQNIGGT